MKKTLLSKRVLSSVFIGAPEKLCFFKSIIFGGQVEKSLSFFIHVLWVLNTQG